MRSASDSKWDVAVKHAAFFAALLATVTTIMHLGIPQMKVSDASVKLANNVIIRKEWKRHFNYIVENVNCRREKIEAILAHTELANIQRNQFYTDLEESLFQQYVLSPTVDVTPAPTLISEHNWRRTFWEWFYPRVRKEHDAVAGARMIVRFLRERVGINPSYHDRLGVNAIWVQGMTDEAGFERIYVSVLRSVGIAARLNGKRQAEIWTGKEWLTAPRPFHGFLRNRVDA